MLGAIKIKAQCKEILVLSSVDYEPLLAVLQQNDFSVPLLIGSSLTQSEDAVQTLVSIHVYDEKKD